MNEHAGTASAQCTGWTLNFTAQQKMIGLFAPFIYVNVYVSKLHNVTYLEWNSYSSFCSCFGDEMMEVQVRARQINYIDTYKRYFISLY